MPTGLEGTLGLSDYEPGLDFHLPLVREARHERNNGDAPLRAMRSAWSREPESMFSHAWLALVFGNLEFIRPRSTPSKTLREPSRGLVDSLFYIVDEFLTASIRSFQKLRASPYLPECGCYTSCQILRTSFIIHMESFDYRSIRNRPEQAGRTS